jgi:hypothetical protein
VAAGAAADGAGQAGQGRLFALLLGMVERLAAEARCCGSSRTSTGPPLHPRPGRLPRLLPADRPDHVGVHVPQRRAAPPAPAARAARRAGPQPPRAAARAAPLTRAELAEQLTALLGADPPARLVDDIHARSEGNPVFAEELVLGGAGDVAGPGELPASLQEVLLARVVRLSRGTQRVLGVAAAAGPGVTQPVLAAVTGMEEAELLDSLREAVDHHVLLPDPDGGGYVFRHSLVANPR